MEQPVAEAIKDFDIFIIYVLKRTLAYQKGETFNYRLLRRLIFYS